MSDKNDSMLDVRDRLAQAMAERNDYDHCFRRVADWEALPDWEREAHPDENPMGDREDCDWWRGHADAALDFLADEGLVS